MASEGQGDLVEANKLFSYDIKTKNAVAVAVMGLVTAVAVRSDKAAPAVLGLVQSVLACALAFGLVLSPDTQGAIMAFTSAVVAMFVRTQVSAPVPASSVDA